MSGWTAVKGKKESGTGGAAIAGGNCDGGCGPGGGVNGSSGMSPGVSWSDCDMFPTRRWCWWSTNRVSDDRQCNGLGMHTTIRVPKEYTDPV